MINPTATIHPKSDVDPGADIGAYCKVWAFASILNDAYLGTGVSVGRGAEIGQGTRIGHHTRISAQVFLPSNSRIGNNSFLGPGVRCGDDSYPIANNEHYEAKPPRIGNNVSIGMSAIILPGVSIGDRARIAAGAIVTKDVPADGFVRCEPARAHEMPIRFLHQEIADVIG